MEKHITRKEAIRLGLPRYDSDKPCKFGHTDGRYTLTSNCTECTKNRVYAYRKSIKEAMESARSVEVREVGL